MRRDVDAARVRELLRQLGREAHGPAVAYLSGGATLILLGLRETSKDVDLRLEPERDELFAAIRRLKDELETNVELASPADFIPLPDGWRDRSPFVSQERELTVRHLELRAQALAKLERFHPRDQADVRALLAHGHVTLADLRVAYAEIEPRLDRFPAIDPEAFRRQVEAAAGWTA